MLKTKKIWTIFALPILALTLVLVLAGCASEKHSAAVIKDASTKAGVLTAKQVKSNINGHTVTTREDSQKSLNATYPKAVANDDYTFDNPYVKVNPYETSPLSALIIFHTDKAVKVNYTVEGKTDKTSITNSVKGYKKNASNSSRRPLLRHQHG